MFKNTLIIFLSLIAMFASRHRSIAADAQPLLPRNEATFAAILDATSEPNRDIRMRAANALGATGRADAVPALRALASDPIPAVRAAALRALCALLPAGASVDLQMEIPVADNALRSTALYAAAKLHFKSREALIKNTLESGTVHEKIAAVKALDMDSAPDARALLKKAIQDPHPTVHAEAIRRLGKADDDEARALVLAAVEDNASDGAFIIRAAACEALGRMKVADTVPQLGTASRDEHSAVRRAATQALASFTGSAPAALAVRQRLVDDDYTVRVAACDSLGTLVDAYSAEALSDRLTDARIEVRDAAVEALIRLSPDGAYKAVLRYAVTGIEADARQRAWHVLGEYAHADTCELAFSTLEDKNFFVSGYAIRILRKHGDRRMIPFLNEAVLFAPPYFSGAPGAVIPAEAWGRPKACDLQVVEGLLAAALFDMREPIEFAWEALWRDVTPHGSGPGSLWPSTTIASACARYLGDMTHAGDDASRAKSADLVKKFWFKSRRMDRVDEICREAFRNLTGEELPVLPPNPLSYGSFFIEVAE